MIRKTITLLLMFFLFSLLSPGCSRAAVSGDEQIFKASVKPMVLLVLGRNHKLYYEAYNDASDLNGDGEIDIGYNPAIDYYGYFDSYKGYSYNNKKKRFEPSSTAPEKTVSNAGEWSGNYLNYLTMSRMDVMRKVLYGGFREVDTPEETVLRRAYIPQDAHSWGKSYESIDKDKYDIRHYTPFDLPVPGKRHLFGSTTLAEEGPPLLRVILDTRMRIWDWASKERPVLDDYYNLSPNNHEEYESDFIIPFANDAHLFKSGPASQIDGTGNPEDAPDDYFLTLFKGELHVYQEGDYEFAVDGNDAVEVLIDGTVVAGLYGSHDKCDCTDHKDVIPLTPGVHSLEFRHQNVAGLGYKCDCTDHNVLIEDLKAGVHSLEFRHQNVAGLGYYYPLYWKDPDSNDIWEIVPDAMVSAGAPSRPGLGELVQSTYDVNIKDLITDYQVRVRVGGPEFPGPENDFEKYPGDILKPVGILQKYRDSLLFGLLTGSYARNTSGGVLRKAISSISDEIDPDTGVFTPVNGIISTINKLKFTGFHYGSDGEDAGDRYFYKDGCGFIFDRPISEGECSIWGNPIAEMMYEGLRYFAGKKSPNGQYVYSAGQDTEDQNLGLPLAQWDDPFVENGYCAKAFMIVISDINPTYDSDQLPGSAFPLLANPGGTYPTDAKDLSINPDGSGGYLNVEALSDALFRDEFPPDPDSPLPGKRYIGQAGTDDGSCSPKQVDGFGNIRGLCPEEPTKQGSYYAAGVAWFGRKTDLNPEKGEQNVVSYMVGLSSPLPRIEIKLSENANPITLVPFGKSVGGAGISETFQPTNTIVDFYVEELTETSGKFRINFEDMEQGGDHDMDAIVEYEYRKVSDTDVEITVNSTYAGSDIIQHMGYIISGTTEDGTYLEVRDQDTDTDEDLDLPFENIKSFTVSGNKAATLLESPLWYAAKWGGFKEMKTRDDPNGNIKPDLKAEWDADGNGVPDTYLHVTNPLKLEKQISRSFEEILSRSASFSAPVAPADPGNGTQHGESVYMALFNPKGEEPWQGNLKKYDFKKIPMPHCGDEPEEEWVLTDRSGNAAVDCDGYFLPGSVSHWALPYIPDPEDGGKVARGGAGAVMRSSMTWDPDSEAPGDGNYHDFRNIVTAWDTDGDGIPDFVDFDPANIGNSHIHEPFTDTNGNGEYNDGEPFTDLNQSGGWDAFVPDKVRMSIINYLYGYTFGDGEPFTDTNGNGTRDTGEAFIDTNKNGNWDESGVPLAKREWILGDMMHSAPCVIAYQEAKFIAVGGNDGMLHVFTDDTITLDREYPAGSEIFAFIPGDLLSRLSEFGDPFTHRYYVDGKIVLHSTDQGKTLIFGERRGGRSYWAIDVTKPDPSKWTVKWHIKGGAGDFSLLGQSWSKPSFAKIRTGQEQKDVREVMIFGGGYDPEEDNFPEVFTDENNNGRYDPDPALGETFIDTAGGTPGVYDNFNPRNGNGNEMGTGIFIVNINDGSLLFSATHGASSSVTGTRQTFPLMKWCFPSDPTVLNFKSGNLLIYITDIYANVWKVTHKYKKEPEEWEVTRIFQANPESSQENENGILSTAMEVKSFYSPDVSYYGSEWTDYPVLYFGTGDRAHPRYRPFGQNRFYVFADESADHEFKETDLLNLTCDELDINADVNQNGFVEQGENGDDALLQQEIRQKLQDGSAKGWYRIMGKQGNCSQDDYDHTSEMILSRPVVYFNRVYFTTYQPVFGDPCLPEGNALFYALEYSWGGAGLDLHKGNDTENTLEDSFRVITESGIPSNVNIMTREGEPIAMFGAGEKFLLEKIPGPPGGAKRILWEAR